MAGDPSGGQSGATLGQGTAGRCRDREVAESLRPVVLWQGHDSTANLWSDMSDVMVGHVQHHGHDSTADSWEPVIRHVRHYVGHVRQSRYRW